MPKSLYADFVGIDVSKNKLDVYETKSKKTFCVSNDKEGIKRLLSYIKPCESLLVLIDLTGGYEMEVVKAFVSKGFNVHRLQGRKFKDFRKSYGQYAKTDKIDAKMFTVYGAKMQETLRLYQLQDTQLQKLVNRRQDILAMLLEENNRKAQYSSDKKMLMSIEPIISVLKNQLEAIEQQIKEYIDKDEELKEKAKVIDSVKSVGEKTTLTLLALFPELGKINRRQAAALAGLAPYSNDSGTISGRRKTGIGRPLVKRTLFMCVMSAIKHDLTLKAFYNKLIKKGKVKMVAIVAVMRKLLIIINNRCKEFYFKRAISNA